MENGLSGTADGRVKQIQPLGQEFGGRKKVRLKTQKPSAKHINLRSVLRKSLMRSGRLRQKLLAVALLAAVRNCHQPISSHRRKTILLWNLKME